MSLHLHVSHWPLTARLSSLLYGNETPTRVLEGKARTWTKIALAIVGAAIALFRTPPDRWNIFWGEDGKIFAGGALNGGMGVVLEDYAGYLHLVPRILAEVGEAIVPLEHMPLAYTVLAASATSLVALAVVVFAEHRIRSRTLLSTLWLTTVASPLAGGEVANNLANLHWFLLFGAMWAVVVRARTPGVIAAQCAMVFFAMMSDPLAGLLLPIVLLRALGLREWPQRAIVLSYLLGLAIQFVAVAQADSREWNDAHPSISVYADYFSFRIALVSLVGTAVTFLVNRAVAQIAALFLVVVVVGFGLRSGGSARALIAFFAAGSLALAIVTTYLEGPWITSVFGSERYALPSVLLLTSALLLSLDVFLAHQRGASLRPVVLALVALLLVLPVVRDYRPENVRQGVPTWTQALDLASEVCQNDSTIAGVLPPVAPGNWVGPYLSCEVVLERNSD